MELPEVLTIHDVFHVSQLKKCHPEMAETPLKDTVPLDEVQLEKNLTCEENPPGFWKQLRELLVPRLSGFAKFNGITTPRKRPRGNVKKI